MLAAEAVAGGQDPLRAAVAHRLATGQLSLPMLPRVASQVVALVKQLHVVLAAVDRRAMTALAS